MASVVHLARKVKVISYSGIEEFSLCYVEFDSSDNDSHFKLFPFDKERQGAIYHDGVLILDLTGPSPLLREE